MINDMTKGEPLKLIFWFSVPLLIGNIFQQLYNIADIVIVGRTLGTNALAAVGAISPIFFFLTFVLVGMTNGFAVVTGQRFGAQDETGVRRSVTISTILSTIFTLAFTLSLTFFMDKFLYWMNVPKEIYKDAYSYIMIVVAGLLVVTLYNLLASVIRALGDSKTPLYFLIFASILNIFLALLFILKFNMGVPGSAIAVVISQLVAALLCVVYVKLKFPILHLKKSDWKFSLNQEDKNFIMEHLNVGLPMALQFSIIGIGILVIQSVCNSFGPDIIAAMTAALRIEQIATMPMMSFGVAIAAYVAQNYGANKFGRIHDGVKKSSIICLLISIGMGIIMHAWGYDLVAIFLGYGEHHILELAKSYLMISALFYFFLGQIFIHRNALQGMSEAVIPLWASIVELVMRCAIAIFFADKWGYYSVFYAGPAAWVTGASIVGFGYYMNLFKIAKKAQNTVRENRKVTV